MAQSKGKSRSGAPRRRTPRRRTKTVKAVVEPTGFERFTSVCKSISIILGALLLVMGTISTGVIWYLSMVFAKVETVQAVREDSSIQIEDVKAATEELDAGIHMMEVRHKADLDLMRKDAAVMQQQVSEIKSTVKDVATDQKVLNENMTRLMLKMNVPPAKTTE